MSAWLPKLASAKFATFLEDEDAQRQLEKEEQKRVRNVAQFFGLTLDGQVFPLPGKDIEDPSLIRLIIDGGIATMQKVLLLMPQ